MLVKRIMFVQGTAQSNLVRIKNYSVDTGEKGKNGKINFHPGIEPGIQRLGVQYTKHQAIT